MADKRFELVYSAEDADKLDDLCAFRSEESGLPVSRAAMLRYLIRRAHERLANCKGDDFEAWNLQRRKARTQEPEDR